MKRIIISLLAIGLLLTACARPGSPSQPLDGDGMERLPYRMIDQAEAMRRMEQDDGHVVVDVRRQDEYAAGHIPGAICIPNETIGSQMPAELPDPDQIILIYCRSGNRSKQAAQKLGAMGYSQVFEFGGILDWTGQIVTGSASEAEPDDEEKQRFAGCYENDGHDTAIISAFGEEYRLSASLYRLTFLEDALGAPEGERLVFRTLDAAGNPLTLSFYQEGETFTLRVDESTWERLAPETVFQGFVRTAEAPLTDWELSDLTEAAEPPRGHYAFSPKVCSVYMEELFGKDMCDAWFSLVDAVLAGEDTFACKDQHTYDWVMGQFPERCLPILQELIDYAYDREHSVKDGVASFTYLVSPAEAKARIEAFGAQIEEILNTVFLDDYSDFEKAFALYGYFCQRYEYDYALAERMNQEYVPDIGFLRFFRAGSGVCQEISVVYSYLLMQAGVEATVMSGPAHQWSYVRLNGRNYHIDPTFAITDYGSLSYFLMTDEQREASGFAKADFIITSNYAQDHPHPDYTADDDRFSPLWEAYAGELSHETHIATCPIGEDENGEWRYLAFDYTGY